VKCAPNSRRVLIGTGLAVAVLILLALLLRWRHEPSRQWIDESANSAVKTIAGGGKVVLSTYARATLNRHEGLVRLEGGTVIEQSKPSLTQLVARTLALAPGPMTRTAITDAIWQGPATHARMESVGRVLSSHCAFVHIAPGWWELGRRAASPSREDPRPIRRL
jgi:hypothetical protein